MTLSIPIHWFYNLNQSFFYAKFPQNTLYNIPRNSTKSFSKSTKIKYNLFLFPKYFFCPCIKIKLYLINVQPFNVHLINPSITLLAISKSDLLISAPYSFFFLKLLLFPVYNGTEFPSYWNNSFYNYQT